MVWPPRYLDAFGRPTECATPHRAGVLRDGCKKLERTRSRHPGWPGLRPGSVGSIFPADEITKAYLSAQGRSKDFKAIHTGEGEEYIEELEVDLSKIVPMVALPNGPSVLCRYANLAGTKIDQALIGGCMGGSVDDLGRVASILKGKSVHPRWDCGWRLPPGKPSPPFGQRGLGSNIGRRGRLEEASCSGLVGHGQHPSNLGITHANR